MAITLSSPGQGKIPGISLKHERYTTKMMMPLTRAIWKNNGWQREKKLCRDRRLLVVYYQQRSPHSSMLPPEPLSRTADDDLVRSVCQHYEARTTIGSGYEGIFARQARCALAKLLLGSARSTKTPQLRIQIIRSTLINYKTWVGGRKLT